MSEGDASSRSLLSITVRSGGTVEMYADRVSDTTGVYPLAQIGEALLVVDPAAPPLPNGMPTPAVQLRLGNGRTMVVTPANPHDANRLLDAILTRRPDLRTPPPPPPGYMPGDVPPGGHYSAPPLGYAPGYTAAVPGYPGAQPDYTLAGLSHLSVFFAPILLPLIVWLTQRDKSPYVARQAKQAFFWHLIVLGVSFVLLFVGYAGIVAALGSSSSFSSGEDPTALSGVFTIFFVIWGIVVVLGILNVVFGIIGAVKAFKGEPFSYPLLGGL